MLSPENQGWKILEKTGKACGKCLALATLKWDIINAGSEDNEQFGQFYKREN